MSIDLASATRTMVPSHVPAPDGFSIPSAVGSLEAVIEAHASLVVSLRDRLEAAGVLATQSPSTQGNSGPEPSFCALATHLNGLAQKLASQSNVVRDISNRLQL